MNKIIFYKTDKPILANVAYQNMCNICCSSFNVISVNKKEINNCKKEIFPIIVLAHYLNYKEIQFLGAKNNSIDAILRNYDSKILNIECTSSIDFRTLQIISEYNKKYSVCYTSPRTKAIDIEKEEKQNYSDVIFKGSTHKRVFIPQNIDNIPFEEGIIDNNLVKSFAELDIKHINQKIQKGIKNNCYKNFILILSINHDLPIEKIPEYSEIIYNYWIKVSNNPFEGLFIVIYDSVICKEFYKEKIYNPFIMPIPIFLYMNN